MHFFHYISYTMLFRFYPRRMDSVMLFISTNLRCSSKNRILFTTISISIYFWTKRFIRKMVSLILVCSKQQLKLGIIITVIITLMNDHNFDAHTQNRWKNGSQQKNNIQTSLWEMERKMLSIQKFKDYHVSRRLCRFVDHQHKYWHVSAIRIQIISCVFFSLLNYIFLTNCIKFCCFFFLSL